MKVTSINVDMTALTQVYPLRLSCLQVRKREGEGLREGVLILNTSLWTKEDKGV